LKECLVIELALCSMFYVILLREREKNNNNWLKEVKNIKKGRMILKV